MDGTRVDLERQPRWRLQLHESGSAVDPPLLTFRDVKEEYSGRSMRNETHRKHSLHYGRRLRIKFCEEIRGQSCERRFKILAREPAINDYRQHSSQTNYRLRRQA